MVAPTVRGQACAIRSGGGRVTLVELVRASREEPPNAADRWSQLRALSQRAQTEGAQGASPYKVLLGALGLLAEVLAARKTERFSLTIRETGTCVACGSASSICTSGGRLGWCHECSARCIGAWIRWEDERASDGAAARAKAVREAFDGPGED